MGFSRWVLGGGKLEGGGNPKHPRGGNWGAPFPWQSMYPDSEQTPKMKRQEETLSSLGSSVISIH